MREWLGVRQEETDDLVDRYKGVYEGGDEVY